MAHDPAMTRTAALSAADQLRTALLDHGVARVSIELVQGRGGSGWINPHRWVGTMGHHIATRRTQGKTPGLALIKTGRADLPGPLANGYGGFDQVARIICMAWANHPGQGGPWTFPTATVPANNGRPYIFGWEFEGGIDAADFTDSYREFMARCHRGTLAWLDLDEQSHIEHKTWAPNRKIDRLGYTLTQARNEITRITPKGDTMPFLPLNKGDGGPRHPKQSDVGFLQGLLARAGATIQVTGIYDDQTATAVTQLLGPNRPRPENPGEWVDGGMMDDIIWLLAVRAATTTNPPAPLPPAAGGPSEAQVRAWAADEISKRLANG